MSSWHLKQAARILKSGGVIAYPTEAVYGLGCIPEDFAAIQRILSLKQRPMHMGLILVAADIEQVEPYVNFPTQTIRENVQQSWPGHVTWVLPATTTVPFWISGSHSTVAIRVSTHPQIRELCRNVGVLVSTSANPSGCPPATTAMRVVNYFGHSLDYILHGQVDTKLQPSEIRDAVSGAVLRK